MSPNSNDEPGAHETGPTTSGSQFEHEASGDFGSRTDYAVRGDYGSGSRHFFEHREPFEMEEIERRGYRAPEGDRRASVVDMRVDFEGEGPYGSYRGYYGSHYAPGEGPQSHGGHGKEDYYGYGKADGYEGSFGRYGYNRDHSPYRRDRFDTGPLGRSGFGSREYGGRPMHSYGGDYGRNHESDYGRSRFQYGRGFGDSYGSHGYGYSGNGGSRSYGHGGMYGREYSRYGYGGESDRFGSDYERSGYGGGYGPHSYAGGNGSYSYGGHNGRRDYRGYGGMHSRSEFGYGRFGRDQSPYGLNRSYFERYSSPHSYGFDRHESPYSYNFQDYSRPGRGYFGKYSRDYDQTSGHYGHRRGPSDPFSSQSYGPYAQSNYGGSPFGHHGGINQHGYERYQGLRFTPFGGGFGNSACDRSMFDQDKFRHSYGSRFGREGSSLSAGPHGYGNQYGHGGYQGYRGNQFWSSGRPFSCEGGQYGYRSGPFEDRGPNGRRPLEHGCRFGGSNPSLDKYGSPPPFPPFSQSRSCPPSSYSNFF